MRIDMQKTFIAAFFMLMFSVCPSVLYGEDSQGAELSVEQARGLYSLLENIKEQKSLFPEEVDAASLKALIKPEYTGGTMLSEENPYALNVMNCVFIEVMKSNLIGFETFVPADLSLAQDECVRIANEWNNNHSFATVSFNGEEFYIQYFMSYAGGIHADNFNDTLEWILSSSFYFENYLKSLVEQK